jgi:glucosylceramidase
LLAYKDEGINIEFICAQNEPQAIQIWESCIYDSEEEIDFVENYLVPELNKNNLDTKVMIYDHNKEKLLSKVNQAFANIKDSSIIKGAAYHFYTGDHFEQLEMVNEKYPNLLLFHTEGCVEYSNTKTKNYVSHGEKYGHDILGDLKHGCNGYLDWNILLDSKGGPNHKLNYCESPIMLCEDEKEYMKNITYYYITQFSRVILPGARRLYTSSYNDKIEMLAYRNPDNTIGIVLLNRDDSNHAYNLHIDNKIIQDNLDSHAIVSYIIEE